MSCQLVVTISCFVRKLYFSSRFPNISAWFTLVCLFWMPSRLLCKGGEETSWQRSGRGMARPYDLTREKNAPKLANVVSRTSGEIRKRVSWRGDGDPGEWAQNISS